MRFTIRNLQKAIGMAALTLAVYSAPAVLAPIADLGVVVAAEEEKPSKYAKTKTKKYQAMSQRFYEMQTKVWEAINGKKDEKTEKVIEQPNLPKAREYLNELKERFSRYNDAEKAAYWTMESVYWYNKEQFPKVIQAYEEFLKYHEAVALSQVANALKTLGQLYLQDGNFNKALEYLYEWKGVTEVFTATDKYTLAQAHFVAFQHHSDRQEEFQKNGRANDARAESAKASDHMAKTLRWLEQAIADFEAEAKTPEEAWWVLQRYCYYYKKDIKKVADILVNLVSHYPKVKYWEQLGTVYSELERPMDHLVAHDSLFMQEKLTQEGYLKNLAYLYLQMEAPYEAAQVLQWGLDNGHLPKTVKNYDVLSQAYYNARETDKAIPVLERAANMSDDGRLMERLVTMYSVDRRDKEVIETAKKAIAKGNLKNEGQTWLYMGISHFYLKQYSAAKKAFAKAKDFSKNKKQAENWISYVEDEVTRLKALDDMRKSLQQAE